MKYDRLKRAIADDVRTAKKKKQDVEERMEMDEDEDDTSSDEENEEEVEAKNEEQNGEAVKTLPRGKWTNRERVLVVCSRGSSAQTRHLIKNLRTLMPHTRSESKIDKSDRLSSINEIAEIANCTKVVYFETRKRQDVYLWLASPATGGPSAKLLLRNIHTMEELRMTGNCLRGSRPLLSFDAAFEKSAHLKLMKRLFIQIFGTPRYHPRSQPFVDHVMTFSVSTDGRIWFRNFQIVDDQFQLQEVGPRLVMEMVRVFAGSFEGQVLYDNPNYESPNLIRRLAKQRTAAKYTDRKLAQTGRSNKLDELETVEAELNPPDELFDLDELEKKLDEGAAQLEKKLFHGDVAKTGRKKQAKKQKKLKKNGGAAKTAALGVDDLFD